MSTSTTWDAVRAAQILAGAKALHGWDCLPACPVKPTARGRYADLARVVVDALNLPALVAEVRRGVLDEVASLIEPFEGQVPTVVLASDLSALIAGLRDD